MAIQVPQPLTDDQLRRAAPSIFADSPRDDLTTRYHMVPTIQVVEGLRKNGFMPYSARQSMSRTEAGGMFSRHEVRFRHVDTLARMQSVASRVYTLDNKWVAAEDIVFDEVGLVNAHDGSAQLELFHGMHRVVCLNGLMVSTGSGARMSIRHSSSIVHNVVEGATRIIKDVPELIEAREAMRALELSTEERVQFAEAALRLRYGGDAPIAPEALLTPRRVEDNRADLWSVYNTVQENMIKGGLRGFTVNTGRRMTTRGLTSITADHGVNRMLWNLAQAARNMVETLDLGAAAQVEAEHA